MPPLERIVTLRAPSDAIRLSVLIPFYKDDPTPLIKALAATPYEDVELVLLSDGAASAHELTPILNALARADMAARLIVFAENQGRSRARNRLAEAAKGEHLLFLDADMAPVSMHFLSQWRALARDPAPAIAFGGLRAPRTAARDQRLHRRLAQISDSRNARARSAAPAKRLATSNLLVRRDILRATPFDTDFVGWGWEDVDWALRARKCAAITHIDIPAFHLGLDDAQTLLRKSTEAAPNFARLTRRHPQATARWASTRFANMLRGAPKQTIAALTAWCTRDPLGILPLDLRARALKLHRAALNASALS